MRDNKFGSILKTIGGIIVCVIIFMCINVFLENSNDESNRDDVLNIRRNEEEQKVVITVSSWDTKGCYAIVENAYSHDILDEKDTIYISFDNINMIYNHDGTNVDYINVHSKDYNYMVGTELEVKFYSVAYENLTNPIIYAEEMRKVADDE